MPEHVNISVNPHVGVNPDWNHQCGLTLLEVMIALLLFTFSIMAVSSMQVHSMKSNASTRNGIHDVLAACKSLEKVLAMPYDDVLLVDPDNGYSPMSPDHGPFLIAKTNSTIEWEVSEGFPIRNAKKIAVTIHRFDQGRTRSPLTLVYIKAKGIGQ